MTIIASFEVEGSDNAPVILGDILLSIKNNSGVELDVSTPLVHEVRQATSIDPVSIAVGHTKKVLLIGKHICVAWTGSFLHARTFLRELRSFWSENHNLSYYDLRNYFDQHEFPNERDLGLIVYHGSKIGFGHISNLPAFPVASLNRVRIGGSGAEHFYQSLQKIDFSRVMGAEENVYQAAWMKMAGYMGLTAAEQVWLGKGLGEGFGGGFELVTFDGEKFIKHGPLLWLFCSFADRGNGTYEMHVLHPFIYQYVDGANTCFVRDEGASAPTRIYWISPPDQSLGALPGIPEMLSAHTIICSMRGEDGADVRYGAFINIKKLEATPSVQVQLKAGQDTQIKIADDLLKKLCSSAPSGRKVTAVNVWGSVLPIEAA